MNILILTEDYPCEKNPYALSYIHTRVSAYIKHGLKCTVLSFRAQRDYVFEEVSVVSSISNIERFDLVVSHAPNLRHHIRFLNSNIESISKLVFWVHGHEVMNVFSQYPKPYKWAYRQRLNRIAHLLYSPLKLRLLRYFLEKFCRVSSVHFVFVSGWMKNVFFSNIFRLPDYSFSVINNPVNPVFTDQPYEFDSEYSPKKGVCIRPWDNSKYAIDMVVDFFQNNPELKCDIYGRGSFPKRNHTPQNVVFYSKFLVQSELSALISKYDFAVLPTRLDAQGVFACELATFGIPLIVNDIPIMREMLEGFSNVVFIDDADFSKGFDTRRLAPSNISNNRFCIDQIVRQEIALMRDID